MGARKKMRVGDLLTFKAATRCSYAKVTRKITGFDHFGRPLVRYAGWRDFIVLPREIISVAHPERCDVRMVGRKLGTFSEAMKFDPDAR